MRLCCSYAESDFHLKLFFGGVFFWSETNRASSLWFLSSSGAGRYTYSVHTLWQLIGKACFSTQHWNSIEKVPGRLQALFKRIIELLLPYLLFHIPRKNFELFTKDTVWDIYKGHQVRFSLCDHQSYFLQFFCFVLLRKSYKQRTLKENKPKPSIDFNRLKQN